jgi:hypothetical protein
MLRRNRLVDLRRRLISIIVITNQFAFSEARRPVHVNIAKRNYAKAS